MFFSPSFLLTSLASLFLAPAVMLFVGKKLLIASPNFNYKRLLLIVFIGLLIGSFFTGLFPYSSTIASIICLLWPIKKQLNTNWTQALALTFSGIIVLTAFSYLSIFLLLRGF